MATLGLHCCTQTFSICSERGLLSIFSVQASHYSFPGGSLGKESAHNAGDPGLIYWSGRSPGEGNGNPLQCSFLENSMNEEPGGLQYVGSYRVGHD